MNFSNSGQNKTFLNGFQRSFVVGICMTVLTGFALFTSNGTFLKWDIEDGDTINFILNPSNCDCDLTESEIRGVFLNSFGKWNEVNGSFFQFGDLEEESPSLFEDDPSLSSTEPEFDDGLNVIGFSDDVPSPFAGFARFKVEGDHIVEADVFLASGLDYNLKTLESLVTHELGHTLGLGHDHADVESVMSYGRDNERLRLGVDDIIGLITLYPESGKEPKPDFGCSTILPIDGSPPFFDQALINFLLWLGLMWLLLSVTKHRIKKSSGDSTLSSFYKGVFVGGGLLIGMAACADLIETEDESSRSSNPQARLFPNPLLRSIHSQGKSNQQALSFYIPKTSHSRSIQETSPGPLVEGGDSFTLGRPDIIGNKYTFFCPRGD